MTHPFIYASSEQGFYRFLRRAIQMNPKMKLEGVYELNFSLDVISELYMISYVVKGTIYFYLML